MSVKTESDEDIAMRISKEAALLSLCNILASVEQRLRSVRYHLDAGHDGKMTKEGEHNSARYLANKALNGVGNHVEVESLAAFEHAREVLEKARKDARCV